MKVDKYKTRLRLKSEEGDSLTVQYDNRGDPYTEGVVLEVHTAYNGKDTSVYLEGSEVKELRDLLLKLYPVLLTSDIG